MQFSDLQSYVLDRLEISAADTNRVTQIKSVLNQTYLQLAAEEELQVGFSSISISANATNANLPAGVTGIRTLRNGGYPMLPISEMQMTQYVAATTLGAGPTSPAAPFYYTLTAPLVIAIWPSPSVSTTLTGLFVQVPTTMSANTDTPSVMPAAFHDLLAELTVQRIAISEESLWPQNLGSEIAQDLLNRFRAWNRDQQGQSTSVIPLRGYTA